LQDERKEHLIQFYDEHPLTSKQDAVDSLNQTFEGFSLKKTSVGNFILYNCSLTIKRLTLQPNARNNTDKMEKCFGWVTAMLKSDMGHLRNCVFVDEAAFMSSHYLLLEYIPLIINNALSLIRRAVFYIPYNSIHTHNLLFK
jgi:hypothetical protein